ncbi:MAG: substrate-binding domain-containing protein, partial [Thermoplasmata archaeon]|nr:substrate-binding domain-containing protein [Thermoplasmata archaeon]
AGAVTLTYHVNKLQGLNLTGPILAAIYLGQITNWNVSAITSINPGVVIPTLPIVPVVRADGSGTTFAFTSYLSAENTTWKSTIGAATKVSFPTVSGEIGAIGSEGVAGAVATTNGAIGYVELNYAEEEGANVGIAKILNPAGNYIAPTVADTALAVNAISSFPQPTDNWSGFSILNQPGAGTYPIATFTYIFVYEDLTTIYKAVTQPIAQALVSFLWWITHDGQTSATGLFYVPLPSLVVTSVCEPALQDITYNGAAQPSH